MDVDNSIEGADALGRSLPNGKSPLLRALTKSASSFSGCSTVRRDAERGGRVWELPGTQQDPQFINKRIENARQPFTIFEIIRDQQQSLTGANLTTAFVKLAQLTTVENVKHVLKSHRIFKGAICLVTSGGPLNARWQR